MTDLVQFSQTLHQWMDVFMHRSMSGWRHYVRTNGLSMPQFSILMRLHYRGECGISNISEHMDISAAAASQLVERLVQSGLIERTEDPHDRRARQLRLTEKGNQFIETGMDERYRWADELTASLNKDERLKVSEALEILIRAAQDLDIQPEQAAV
jgi:DNA-binding MarR family transcriptional regulator